MRLIKPYVEQISPVINGVEFLKRIEQAGRVCYKSEERITDTSAFIFVEKLIKRGHDAMIEHAENISMKFVCDRGVSHEIVRHRLFSFAQESTRYCNYSDNHVTYIIPCWMSEHIKPKVYTEYEAVPYQDENDWLKLMWDIERLYKEFCMIGWQPQQARSILPNSLKTEIIVTGNLREWRHFFKLRTARDAHPQMREVANMALNILKPQIPIVFDDISNVNYNKLSLKEELAVWERIQGRYEEV